MAKLTGKEKIIHTPYGILILQKPSKECINWAKKSIKLIEKKQSNG